MVYDWLIYWFDSLTGGRTGGKLSMECSRIWEDTPTWRLPVWEVRSGARVIDILLSWANVPNRPNNARVWCPLTRKKIRHAIFRFKCPNWNFPELIKMVSFNSTSVTLCNRVQRIDWCGAGVRPQRAYWESRFDCKKRRYSPRAQLHREGSFKLDNVSFEWTKYFVKNSR